MPTPVDELVTILGVDIARDAMAKLQRFSNSVAGVAKKVAVFGTVVTGAAAATGLFIRSVAKDASELDKLSQRTGISTDALQEWSYAAQSMDLDAKNIKNDLVNLQKTMSSPIPGQFNQNLMMLGVSTRNANGALKTTDEILLDLSDKFKGMSQQRAEQWASKVGISPDTLLLLQKGRDGIEELKQEAHKLGAIIPEDSIKKAAEFKRQLSEMTFVMRSIASQAAIAVIPSLSKMLGVFKEFIVTNREWIQLNLEALMTGIANGFERFYNGLKKVGDKLEPFIEKIKEFMPEMTNAEFVTHLVTGALTGLAIVLAPLLVKFALIGAAIAAVSLVFEDLFVFLNGGESVIGDFFKAFEERWPELFAALKALASWFKDNIGPALEFLWDVIKKVLGALGEVFGVVMDKLNEIAGPIKDFFATFSEEFPALFDGIKKLAEYIKDYLGGAFDFVIILIKTMIATIFDLLKAAGWVIKKIAQASNWVLDKLGLGKKDDDPFDLNLDEFDRPGEKPETDPKRGGGGRFLGDEEPNLDGLRRNIAAAETQQAGKVSPESPKVSGGVAQTAWKPQQAVEPDSGPGFKDTLLAINNNIKDLRASSPLSISMADGGLANPVFDLKQGLAGLAQGGAVSLPKFQDIGPQLESLAKELKPVLTEIASYVNPDNTLPLTMEYPKSGGFGMGGGNRNENYNDNRTITINQQITGGDARQIGDRAAESIKNTVDINAGGGMAVIAG